MLEGSSAQSNSSHLAWVPIGGRARSSATLASITAGSPFMAARTATSAPGSSAIAASVVILDRANADQGSCQRSSDVSSCRARLSVLDGRTWSCCEGVTSVRVRLKDRANAQQRLKDLANVAGLLFCLRCLRAQFSRLGVINTSTTNASACTGVFIGIASS